MRAVVCRRHGTPDVLTVEEMPSPVPGPGQIRVGVAAAGVNFADILRVKGTYQEKLPFPFVIGAEIAGTVLEVGPGVATLKPGDRVFAQLDSGGYAEEAVCDAERVHPVPEGIDLALAAGFPIVYGTSEIALNRRAHLAPGETLLVLGAAGGVGLSAVEIGKAMGARVIAAARGAEKLAIARDHGAHETIDYAAENLRDRVKALTAGKGADVVYDPVGGEVFDAALRATAWQGRIVVVGFAGGNVPQVPANLLLVKNIAVVGVYWGSYQKHDPAEVAASFDRLLAWWRAGLLKPHVSRRVKLENAADALRLLSERRSTGKVVLTTGLHDRA